MTAISFQLDGIDGVIKEMIKEGRATMAGYKMAMFVEGEVLRTNILRDVPRDTGFLAATVFHEQHIGTLGGFVEIIGATADYALYVEFAKRGTRFKRGKSRFISDNFEKMKSGFTDRVARRTALFSKAGK